MELSWQRGRERRAALDAAPASNANRLAPGRGSYSCMIERLINISE